jgi:hypothetical protein
MNIEQLLTNATSAIGANYFQLPIDGSEDPIYRERVYCYELYHQLRLIWPEDEGYELSGEIDKSGHPLIRGNDLDNVKPDLLVHIPGNMKGNHTIIEVKPINAALSGIAKDLGTLTAFRRYADYQRGIYLFYGDGDIQIVVERIRKSILSDRQGKIDLDLIEVWLHPRVGEPAVRLNLQNV